MSGHTLGSEILKVRRWRQAQALLVGSAAITFEEAV
jgi:hypothetical protein